MGMTHAGSCSPAPGGAEWHVLSACEQRAGLRRWRVCVCVCVCVCGGDTVRRGRGGGQARVPPPIRRVYPYSEGLMRSDRPLRRGWGGLCTPPLINAVPGGVLPGEA